MRRRLTSAPLALRAAELRFYSHSGRRCQPNGRAQTVADIALAELRARPELDFRQKFNVLASFEAQNKVRINFFTVTAKPRQ
jgi:hypothetical protein